MSDLSKYQILDDLYKIISARKGCNPKSSYTAKLFKKGRHKIAQKLGEESVELVIEAIADQKKEAIGESADVLFHMLMLFADMNITPQEVMDELQKRLGVSGIEEKRKREDNSE